MRIFGILICWLAFGALAHAAPSPALSQRSLLQPGLWWSPTYNGHGFDIHVNQRQVGMLWYSYRGDGTPTWYLAAGPLDESGVLRTDLLEGRWSVHGASFSRVGEVKLSRIHSESARFEFSFDGGARGEWMLTPFRALAQREEHDPSGAYSDPAQGGFGLTVAQMGPLQSALYYVYDADGRPVWWLGTRQGNGPNLELTQYRRSCALCPAASARIETSARLAAQVAFASGTARLQFAADEPLLQPRFRELPRPFALITLPLAAREADYRPAYFDDDAALKRFLDITLLEPRNWTSTGSIDFSPPPPSATVSVSSTNLIVAGVDEADRLKSDGRFVYSVGREPGTIRISEIIGEGPELRAHGEVRHTLDAREAAGQRLMLTDTHAVSIASESVTAYAHIEFCPPPPSLWQAGRTKLAVYDRQNPAQPRLQWQAEIDGFLIDVRRLGNQLILVQRYTPKLSDFVYGGSTSTQLERNRARLAVTPLAELLPKIRVGDTPAQPLLVSRKVLLPPIADLRPQPDFTVVTRIDIGDPARRESLALVSGVSAIHVSPRAVYIATSRYARDIARGSFLSATDLHRIDLDSSELIVSGTGGVDGVLDGSPLRQPFRLSEHDGRLRVVSDGDFGEFGNYKLTILEPSAVLPGLLRTVSTLPNADAPARIGQPGELLHATRFVGDRLYAVTFPVGGVDPLYVIDLSNPAAPRIRGQLVVPGFSEYLHPLEGNLLVGVGYQAPTGSAQRGGIKLSLFDVADPARPTQLADAFIGQNGSGSAALESHHAFSLLKLADGRHRFAVPVNVHGLADPSPQQRLDMTWQPFSHNALFVYDVSGSGSGATLSRVGAMPVNSGRPDFMQQARYSARALLMPRGAAYVVAGEVWTAPWDRLSVPVGPR